MSHTPNPTPTPHLRQAAPPTLWPCREQLQGQSPAQLGWAGAAVLRQADPFVPHSSSPISTVCHWILSNRGGMHSHEHRWGGMRGRCEVGEVPFSLPLTSSGNSSLAHSAAVKTQRCERIWMKPFNNFKAFELQSCCVVYDSFSVVLFLCLFALNCFLISAPSDQ